MIHYVYLDSITILSQSLSLSSLTPSSLLSESHIVHIVLIVINNGARRSQCWDFIRLITVFLFVA